MAAVPTFVVTRGVITAARSISVLYAPVRKTGRGPARRYGLSEDRRAPPGWQFDEVLNAGARIAAQIRIVGLGYLEPVCLGCNQKL